MARPIRIMHLITGLNTGGAEMTLLRLLTNMDRQTFETQVVCLIPIGPVGEKIRELNIPVISLEMPPGYPTLIGFRKLLKLIKQFQPDILQTWLYHADFLGLLAAKFSGIQNIFWNIRSTHRDFKQYSRSFNLVFKGCASLSGWPKAVIVNSLAGKATHIQYGYHPKEWIYIPNGIDHIQFCPDIEKRTHLRQEWGVLENECLIGIVGRFHPMKDHPTFLKAAAIAQASHPNVRFVCIGDGPINYVREMKEFADQLNLTKVLWTGPLSDMTAVYNALDILVSSSMYGEGFPNVVAEAMACEKLCVVTDVGDAARLVADTGISIHPGEPKLLAQAIRQVIDLPTSARSILGKEARQRIFENFSLEKMTRTYYALYKHLA